MTVSAAPPRAAVWHPQAKTKCPRLEFVTKCKWTMCCPRYELGMLSMASKTLLFMLERFPQLRIADDRLSLTAWCEVIKTVNVKLIGMSLH